MESLSYVLLNVTAAQPAADRVKQALWTQNST